MLQRNANGQFIPQQQTYKHTQRDVTIDPKSRETIATQVYIKAMDDAWTELTTAQRMARDLYHRKCNDAAVEFNHARSRNIKVTLGGN